MSVSNSMAKTHIRGSAPKAGSPPPHSTASDSGHEGDVVPAPKEFTILWEISTRAETGFPCL